MFISKKLVIGSLAISILATTFWIHNADAKETIYDDSLVVDNEKLLHYTEYNSSIKDLNIKISKDNEDSKEIEVSVIINPDEFTMTDFKNYKKTMKNNLTKLKEDGFESSISIITFNKLLSQEEVKDILNEHSLKLNAFTIQTLINNEERGTLYGIPNDNELFPEDKINEFLNGAENLGIYSIEVEMSNDIDLFNKLESHPSIYLVDNSIEILKVKATQNINVMKENKGSSSHHYDINVPDFYWFIDASNK